MDRGGVGVGRGGNGGNGAVLVFENSILLIRVQGYRGLIEKWKTVKTVDTLRYSVLKIREYFRGVVYCASFGIYMCIQKNLLPVPSPTTKPPHLTGAIDLESDWLFGPPRLPGRLEATGM